MSENLKFSNGIMVFYQTCVNFYDFWCNSSNFTTSVTLNISLSNHIGKFLIFLWLYIFPEGITFFSSRDLSVCVCFLSFEENKKKLFNECSNFFNEFSKKETKKLSVLLDVKSFRYLKHFPGNLGENSDRTFFQKKFCWKEEKEEHPIYLIPKYCLIMSENFKTFFRKVGFHQLSG